MDYYLEIKANSDTFKTKSLIYSGNESLFQCSSMMSKNPKEQLRQLKTHHIGFALFVDSKNHYITFGLYIQPKTEYL